MSTSASRRKWKVMFQRLVSEIDDYGTEVGTNWTDYAPAYADIFYGTGSEQRAAAQESGSQVATFEVPSNARSRALTITDRIAYPPGTYWDITAVHDLGRNKGVHVTALKPAKE
jgi:head-tail adaptor